MWVRKAQQFTTSIITMYGVLVGKVKEFLEEQLETIAQTKGYKILEARVMPGHIHLFIEADPFDSPNIVKIFKGVAGLGMSRKFADIVPKLWRRVIWSPSYYVETAGHVSAETIERCIYTADGVEAWFIYRLKPVVFPRKIL